MVCLPPQGTPPPHTHSSRHGPQHTQHTSLRPSGIAGCGWPRYRRLQRLPMYLTLRKRSHRLLVICLPPQGTPTPLHTAADMAHSTHSTHPYPPPVSQGVGGHCTAASTVPMHWSCRKISHRLPHPMRMISIPPRDTSPHQDSASTAPSSTPPPASLSPPPVSEGVGGHGTAASKGSLAKRIPNRDAVYRIIISLFAISLPPGIVGRGRPPYSYVVLEREIPGLAQRSHRVPRVPTRMSG